MLPRKLLKLRLENGISNFYVFQIWFTMTEFEISLSLTNLKKRSENLKAIKEEAIIYPKQDNMHFLKKYLSVIFPPKIIQSISLKSKQNTFEIEMSKCFNFQVHIKLNMPNVNRSHASPPILSTTPHQITKKGGRLVFALTGSLFITCKKKSKHLKR